MTRDEFIEALKIQTSDAAVSGTLANESLRNNF
jgi:hypothetical protein